MTEHEDQSAIVEAQNHKIVDVASYRQAGEIFRGIKARRAAVRDLFEPLLDGAKNAKNAAEANRKAVKATWDEWEAPLVSAQRIIESGMLAWEDEQRNIAAQRQREADEKARKAEEDRRLAEAEQLVSEGKEEEAEQLLDEDIVVHATVPNETPKLEGIHTRWTYSGKVVDLMALIKYICVHPEYINLIEAHQPSVNALARSQRDSMDIPGVQLVKTSSKVGRD
jgi:hypothetical protein